MINKVRLELKMYLLVSNAFVTLDECHKSICMLTWHLYRRIVHFINLFIIKVYCFIFISLIFNNYVMEDYACFHDLLEHFRIEKSCRSINNCKSCLEYSKCTLNILPICLLGFCNFFFGVGIVFTNFNYFGYMSSSAK